MIEYLFTDEKTVIVLNWLLSHPTGYYSIATIAFDIQDTIEASITPKEMAEILHTLEIFDVINVKEETPSEPPMFIPEVFVQLNLDSDIVDAVIKLDGSIERYVIDFMVDSNFSAEYHEVSKHPFARKAHQRLKDLDKNQCCEIAEDIKNWRNNMKEPKNPLDKIMYDEIKEAFEELEENNEFQDFVEFVKNAYKLN